MGRVPRIRQRRMPVRATKRGAERTPLQRRLRRADLRRELRRPRGRARARGHRRARAHARPLRDRRAPDLSACAAPTEWLRRTSGLEDVDPPDLPRPRHAHADEDVPLDAAVDLLDLRLPRALRAAARPGADVEFETAKVDGRDRRFTVHTDRGDLTAPLIVDALGWRRVLSDARERSSRPRRASRAAWRSIPHAHRRRPRAVARPAPTCAPATRGASPPATSCASASARSTRATTSRSRPCAWPSDLDVPAVRYQGNWIPHQLRAAGRGRHLLRRRQRRPLPADDRRGHPHRALLRPRLRPRAARGRSTAARRASRRSTATPTSARSTAGPSRGCCACSAGSARLNPLPRDDQRARGDGPPALHRLVLRALPRHRPAGLRRAGRPSAQERRRASRPPWRGPFPAVPAPAPGHRRCSNRLRLAHKLVLIALVLIAPALYATWQFRSQQNAQIAFSAKERVGIEEIVPASRLLADLANGPGARRPRRRRATPRRSPTCPARARPSRARSPRSTPPTPAWARGSAPHAMWKRLRDVDPGDRRRRSPIDARRDARRLRPPHRRHRRAHRAGRQRVQPDPRSRPRLVLRDGRAGQQGAARARRPPGA